MAGVGVRMKVPSVRPAPRTGSSTCRVGRPTDVVGHVRGLSRTVPSGSIHAPLPDGRVPHETAVLEREQVAQLRRHRHQDEVGLLTAGDAFGHVVDPTQVEPALGRGTSMSPAPRRQLADEQSDDHEEQLRGEVGLPADPERPVGAGEKEVERRRGDDAPPTRPGRAGPTTPRPR